MHNMTCFAYNITCFTYIIIPFIDLISIQSPVRKKCKEELC